MNFTEFETLMSSKGIITLAEMARALDTTPQAVSNWKARNQVPYHIIAKINEKTIVDTEEKIIVNDNKISDDKVLSLTDIMLILTEQIKVILIIPFIFLFLAVTNEKFIKEPIFISTGTILVPEIYLASLETKKEVTLAISSGFPKSPKGIFFFILFISLIVRFFLVNFVFMKPGEIVFTLIFFLPNSIANVLLAPFNACFDITYGSLFFLPKIPYKEEIKVIEQLFFAKLFLIKEERTNKKFIMFTSKA